MLPSNIMYLSLSLLVSLFLLFLFPFCLPSLLFTLFLSPFLLSSCPPRLLHISLFLPSSLPTSISFPFVFTFSFIQSFSIHFHAFKLSTCITSYLSPHLSLLFLSPFCLSPLLTLSFIHSFSLPFLVFKLPTYITSCFGQVSLFTAFAD